MAAGFAAVPDGDAGVILYATRTGEQTGTVGFDDKLGFGPGAQFASWGNGVVGLAFSPDQTLLYGVSNDTVFAWDLHERRYLWTVDVPEDPATVNEGPDLAGFGHV